MSGVIYTVWAIVFWAALMVWLRAVIREARRDYLAAHALLAVAARQTNIAAIARQAYEIADAMLQERSK